MNDTQLLSKISKASYAYRNLYGKFPDKVGVHYRRRSALPYSIRFPIIPEISITSLHLSIETLDDMQCPAIDIHETRIEPFTTIGMLWDDVFLPLRGDEQKTVNSEFIEKMAKEFE